MKLALKIFAVLILMCATAVATAFTIKKLYVTESQGPQITSAFVEQQISEIAEDLNARGRSVIFQGDGVPVSKETLARLMTVPYSFAPAHLDRQRAAAVAALAWSYYQDQGDACMVSADDFRPEYLRLAQAEQEHSERRSFSLLLEK